MEKDDPDFFDRTRLDSMVVAVVGLGLMGGSLLMALRGKCTRLLGIDPQANVCRQALNMGLVNDVFACLSEMTFQPDALILAAPVNAILRILSDLPALPAHRTMVIDLGSTKAQVIKAMQALPEHFDPLGGHPMCGKEKLTLANAEAQLFQDSPFALCPLERSTQDVRRFAVEVVRALGARPIWIDPAEHDAWVASTSHVPYLTSCAVSLATPPESRDLVGPGFRSVTRLADTPSAMMMDVLISNRQNILTGLQRTLRELQMFENLLKDSNFSQLELKLQAAATCHSQMVERTPQT